MKRERTTAKTDLRLFRFYVRELKDRWLVTDRRRSRTYTVMKGRRRPVGQCVCQGRAAGAVLCEH